MHDRVIGNVGIEAGSLTIDVHVEMRAKNGTGIDKSVAYPGDLFVQAVDHVRDGRAVGRDPPRRSGEERDE